MEQRVDWKLPSCCLPYGPFAAEMSWLGLIGGFPKGGRVEEVGDTQRVTIFLLSRGGQR